MAKKNSAREIVREIARDRKRGATALADRALDALSEASALMKLRPSMPLIAATVRLAKREGVAAARKRLRESTRAIANQAKEYLPEGARYIVFGASGTIEAVLKAVKGRKVRDHPADVALVGADALYSGGDFVNAAGTEDFVRKARRAGAAVFVVASVLKRVRKEVPLESGFERVRGHLVHAFLGETGIRYPRTGAVRGPDPSWIKKDQ